MIRVFIADDHPVVREGIKHILAAHSDILITGEAASGPEALVALSTAAADVLVLDIGMPGEAFIPVLRRLRTEHPGLAVLVHSIHPEAQFALPAFRAGARGYLAKDQSPRLLVTAIRRLHGGGRFASPELGEQALRAMEQGAATPGSEHLSEREEQVLRLLVAGKSLKMIGAELGLNRKTVSTYRARLLAKLGLQSNQDLVRYAMRQGLTE